MKKTAALCFVSLLSASCLFKAEKPCDKYCELMEANCPSTFADDGEFDDDACYEACEDYESIPEAGKDLGEPVANADSLECRVYHANNATGSVDGIHCAHAGPTGGGVCTLFEPICERMCGGEEGFEGAVEFCRDTEDAFVSNQACAEFCNALPIGQEGEDSGNTQHCRLTWALSAAQSGDTSLCANAGAESSTCR